MVYNGDGISDVHLANRSSYCKTSLFLTYINTLFVNLFGQQKYTIDGLSAVKNLNGDWYVSILAAKRIKSNLLRRFSCLEATNSKISPESAHSCMVNKP